MPHVMIIAGPNGAGKTTTAPALLDEALTISNFVNADTIAQGCVHLRPKKPPSKRARAIIDGSYYSDYIEAQ